jgi:hypothetical protein
VGIAVKVAVVEVVFDVTVEVSGFMHGGIEGICETGGEEASFVLGFDDELDDC